MRRAGLWGHVAIFVGTVILLSLILPRDLFLLLLAVALIYLGLWYIRRC